MRNKLSIFLKKMKPFTGRYNRLEMFFYGFLVPVIIIVAGALFKDLYFEYSLLIVYIGLFFILSGIFKRCNDIGINPFIRILFILIPMIGVAFYIFLFLDESKD